mmetsp:Transcript_2772/g.3833  ORF Transcript_2772/g.3833 Transcript_2772/m.3833 type:complete len:210 (-) Transcript_2772:453-1082(-)
MYSQNELHPLNQFTLTLNYLTYLHNTKREVLHAEGGLVLVEYPLGLLDVQAVVLVDGLLGRLLCGYGHVNGRTYHVHESTGSAGSEGDVAEAEEHHWQSSHLPSNIGKDFALGYIRGEGLSESKGDHRHDGHAVLQGQLHEALARLKVHHHLIRPFKESHFLHTAGTYDGTVALLDGFYQALLLHGICIHPSIYMTHQWNTEYKRCQAT